MNNLNIKKINVHVTQTLLYLIYLYLYHLYQRSDRRKYLCGDKRNVISGQIEAGIEVTGRRVRRRKQLLVDHKESRGYWKLK
jgi:hypothetical protein